MNVHEHIEQLASELERLNEADDRRRFEVAKNIIDASDAEGYRNRHLGLALYIYAIGTPDEQTEELCERAIAAAREYMDKQSEGRATRLLGWHLLRLQQYDQAYEHLYAALAIAQEIGDSYGEGMARDALAELQWANGNTVEAITNSQLACELLADTVDAEVPLQNFGMILEDTGDYYSALSIFEKWLEIVRGKKNLDELHCFLWLAMMHRKLGNFSASIEYAEKALFLGKERNYKLGIGSALNDLGNTAFEMNLLPKAKELITEAFEIFKEINDLFYLAESYIDLAAIAIRENKPSEAISLLDIAARYYEQSKRRRNLDNLYIYYAEAYEQLGDWEKTAHYFKERQKWTDAQYPASLKAHIASAQISLATEQERHEKEIEKMKRQQLEQDLSNTTLHLLAQTELLANIRTEMMATIRKIPPTEPVAQELREKLRLLPCQSIDWEKFDTQFKAAHPEFTKKLLELYPNLTGMESRICSLIRMNLKSEEIARLFCLSDRTVENHRQHIREKMKLKHAVDLAIHLAKI